MVFFGHGEGDGGLGRKRLLVRSDGINFFLV